MSDEAAETRPTIRLERDGPLIVSGLRSLRNSRGEPIKAVGSVRLCRCGASRTKPFCDNTHVDIGFSDQKSDERVPDQLDTYDGSEITIRDNRGICSHAGFCTAGLPQVWRSDTEPWIDADGADREAIVGTVRKCPSGALAYVEDGRPTPRGYQPTFSSAMATLPPPPRHSVASP
jgi:uncharacterized Fe-S cluster protein YjdI